MPAVGDPLYSYYDFADGYDATNKQLVKQSDGSLNLDLIRDDDTPDHSYGHYHGSNVADMMIQGIKDAKNVPNEPTGDVRILPIRDTGDGNTISTLGVYEGMRYAISVHVAVINLSLDIGNYYDGKLKTLIDQARDQGIAVVTASGNQGSYSQPYSQGIDIDHTAGYSDYPPFFRNAVSSPSYDTNMLVAAATDPSGSGYLTTVSNWGDQHVDFGSLTNSSGDTSYAAGYTSGVAGVIAALLPPSHTAEQVVQTLDASARPISQPGASASWSVTNGDLSPADAVGRVIPGGIVDRTSEPGIAASSPSPLYPNTTATQAVDGTWATKWIDSAASPWLQYKLATPRVITQYTLITGDDAPTRDPKNWRFLASNDGTNWTTLDTRSNQAFAGRHQSYSYTITNASPYLYFRLQVDANNGDSLTQLSEFRLLGPYGTTSAPAAPTGVSAIPYSWKGDTVSWTPVAGVTYTLERSTSSAFTSPTVLSTQATSPYNDYSGTTPLTTWYYRVKAVAGGQTSAPSAVVSATTSRRVVGDFDGDGKTDLAISKYLNGYLSLGYRPSHGGNDVLPTPIQTASTTIPLAADYDGDGRADFAYYDPTTSNFTYFPSSGGAAVTTQFGAPNLDQPITGDFDGDGQDDLAVFEPRSGSGSAFAYRPSSAHDINHDKVIAFGSMGDIPIPADFDGDGKTDIAVMTQVGVAPTEKYLSSKNNAPVVFSQFGPADALPLLGDFNGDGKADDAVYVKRSDGIHTYYRVADGSPVVEIHWGDSANILVTGDYDGDGVTDVAQFTPSPGPGAATWQERSTATTYNLPSSQFGWTDGPTVPLIGTPKKKS